MMIVITAVWKNYLKTERMEKIEKHSYDFAADEK